MTIDFNWLENINKNITSDDVLNTLIEYDNTYFENWIIFNKTYNPTKSISEYIIDLPVSEIDIIISLLVEKS